MIRLIERILIAAALTLIIVLQVISVSGGLAKKEVKQEMEVHTCREFILYSGDTVEVIYTKHVNRHLRKGTFRDKK